MASWDDVRRVVSGLPGTDERTSRGCWQWRVADKLVDAWLARAPVST